MPEPYGGQKFCPVSSEPLGARGPGLAVSVPAIDSAYQKPALQRFLQRFQKRPPEITIYVCCPECAARVKSDPGTYLFRVVAERSSGSGSRPGGSSGASVTTLGAQAHGGEERPSVLTEGGRPAEPAPSLDINEC